jgi:ubiquinone/menaquinone biosynthesis C-methylase UbiE
MINKLRLLLKNSPTTNWKIEDFSGIDQLHLGGISATLELLNWLPSGAKDGLDIGCGLGGTSRLLSDMRDCNMVGLDLNSQYIEAATLLNQSIQPEPKCQFVIGNSLHLPFLQHRFDFVISQHATMNIKQKETLLRGLYSVLKPQGHLLIHEIMLQQQAGENDVLYPTPWAQEKSESHLCHWQTFNDLALAIGFKVDRFEDNTDAALTWIRQTRQQKLKPPFTPPLALGPNAATMSANVLGNIEAGYLQVVSARLSKS